MAPDYDLSDLINDQVDLWIHLRGDTILSQIVADQAERMGFSPALVSCPSDS